MNQQEKKSTKPYRLQEIFPVHILFMFEVENSHNNLIFIKQNMEIGYKTEEERDNLAKNYMYTTSTQE